MDYDLLISVGNGVITDVLNGSIVYNVYYIAISYSDYVIDCLNSNKELLGSFAYARNKKSYIVCEYNDFRNEITLAIGGNITKEIKKGDIYGN